MQACPSAAIAIAVVDKRQVLEDAQGDAFLPGAPSPAITVPSTVYRTDRAPPRNLLPADYYRITPAQRHTPLVVMLVLSQLSVGTFATDAVASRTLPDGVRAAMQPAWSLAALSIAVIALGASVLHLGRPHLAFRAVIGLASSWVSREIVAFGAFAALALVYAAGSMLPLAAAVREALGWTVGALGLIGVACSVMIYHATRKAWWHATRTGFRFFTTAALLGPATTLVIVSLAGVEPRATVGALAALVVATAGLKAAGELAVLAHLRDRRYTELRRSAVLMTRDLRRWLVARLAALAVGGLALPVLALHTAHAAPRIASFALLVCGELLERTLFFAAASSHGMPGAFR